MGRIPQNSCKISYCKKSHMKKKNYSFFFWYFFIYNQFVETLSAVFRMNIVIECMQNCVKLSAINQTHHQQSHLKIIM